MQCPELCAEAAILKLLYRFYFHQNILPLLFINSRAPHPRQGHSIPIFTLHSSFFILAEMFSTPIVSFAITFTALWSACVSAYPSEKPNVALFNLPAAITPPTGEVLKAVYLGYGTHLMTPLHLKYTNNRNPELYMQCNDFDLFHDRHSGSKTH
jgi:hypothetical protein